jgi:dUTPase
MVVNSPGTIDLDYKQEICVILSVAYGARTLRINPGDSIAQGVFAEVIRPESITINGVERKGGFGSTGEKPEKPKASAKKGKK